MMDTKKLRELAAKATRPEWQAGTAGSCNLVSYDGDDIVGVAHVPSLRNLVYLEACSPDRITALLDALAAAEARAAEVERERDALQRFKEYVHQRLDEAGVATHPDGPHSKAGCRIGDRLDIVFSAHTELWSWLDQQLDHYSLNQHAREWLGFVKEQLAALGIGDRRGK